MNRLLLILAALTLAMIRPSSAATFVVNSVVDSHDAHPGDGRCAESDDTALASCSVRAAIEESSALPQPDTIIIPALNQPIFLTLGTLVIAENGTLIQGEPDLSILDGLGNPFGSPILHIASDSVTLRGLSFQRSRGDALLVTGSHAVIGGESYTHRNIFTLNGLDGPEAFAIRIAGDAATDNLVLLNFIGMTGNGTERRGNSNGIGLSSGAHDNIIGRSSSSWANLISGNVRFGLIITGGAHHNEVLGNIIGADINGTSPAPNDSGGILLTGGAHDNRIGNDIDSSGNLISGNGGPGLWIRGNGCSSNGVTNNLIGLQVNGILALGNRLEGVLLSAAAHDNLIGNDGSRFGNLISGNYGSGVRITGVGTAHNTIAGNRIGPDIRGYGSRSNGLDFGHGVRVDSGASANVIGGGVSGRNVISGNLRCGVELTDAGTSGNVVAGNFIGTSSTGVSSLGNSSGIMIWNGASGNLIGGSGPTDGNVIAGNRGDLFPFSGGVMVYDTGTTGNLIAGNKIGTDSTGTRALRNGSAGVIIGLGASNNTVGGLSEPEQNLISGNGSSTIIPSIGAGVHLFGSGTTGNRVLGNRIGLSATGASLPNSGNGVALVEGASGNTIGGEAAGAGNSIAFNRGHGVYLADAASTDNVVRKNSTYANDSLGAAIRRSAQNDIVSPVIALIDSNRVFGTGAPALGVVDLYVAAPDPSGRGEGRTWLAAATATAGGTFEIIAPLLQNTDTITVQGTDVGGNSSEFSANVVVSQLLDVTEPGDGRPERFALLPNYPNPFNANTRISYHLPRTGDVVLTIFNLLGQQVVTLVDARQAAGEYTCNWDGNGTGGGAVASGVYWYRLTFEDHTSVRKMLLLK